MGRNNSDRKGNSTVFVLLISSSLLLIFVMFAASGIRLREGGFADYMIRSIENPGDNLRGRFEDYHAEYIPYEKIRDADMPVKIFVCNANGRLCVYLCSGGLVSVYDAGGLNPADAGTVLKKYGTEEIEYLISAASSEEHLAELYAVAEVSNIQNLIYSGSLYGSESGRSFIETVQSRGDSVIEISSFTKLQTAELRIELSSYPDTAPRSPDIRITSGNFKCLFTGASGSENGIYFGHDETVSADVTFAGCSEILRKITELTDKSDSGYTLICSEKAFHSLSRKERKILKKAFEEVFMIQENSCILICTDGERYSVSPGNSMKEINIPSFRKETEDSHA